MEHMILSFHELLSPMPFLFLSIDMKFMFYFHLFFVFFRCFRSSRSKKDRQTQETRQNYETKYSSEVRDIDERMRSMVITHNLKQYHKTLAEKLEIVHSHSVVFSWLDYAIVCIEAVKFRSRRMSE